MGGWQDAPGELQTPVNYELYIVILIPMETFVCMDSSSHVVLVIMYLHWYFVFPVAHLQNLNYKKDHYQR